MLTWQTFLRMAVVVVFYAVAFWRIAKSNRGTMVIECGSMAIMVVIVMRVLIEIPNVPGWVLGSIGVLLFLLCVLTIGFLLQQGYRATRRRLKKSD